mmetsp:Transcript_34161/g.79747  ORF Transcript_34161/g.79747 Transcript_34161/m.79747 type:complete len:254 (+) Transcript_34161:403-1164(+)
MLLRRSIVYSHNEEVGGDLLARSTFANEVRNHLVFAGLADHAGPSLAGRSRQDSITEHGASLLRDHERVDARGSVMCRVGAHGARHELGQSILCKMLVGRVIILKPRDSNHFLGGEKKAILQGKRCKDPSDALEPQGFSYPVDSGHLLVIFDHLRDLSGHLLLRFIDGLHDGTCALVVVLVLQVVAVHKAGTLHRIFEKNSLPIPYEAFHLWDVDHRKRVNMPVRLLFDGHRWRDLQHASSGDLDSHIFLIAG